ncbi:MAG TPA: efflux transporter outer membrane subunit [Verrucomicrobiae bacterium]|nr:efflux transporter outer membrane subunit [Verrucomicrobiae bacterium]
MNETLQKRFASHRPEATLSTIPLIALGLSGMLLGGCKSGPDFQAPREDMPVGWAGVATPTTSQPSATTTNVADIAQWWKTFNDPMLTRLVVDAVATNLDLQIAQIRVREARASRGIAAGGLWPAASATAAYQRTRPAANVAPNPAHDLFVAGLDAVWELDVFGGLRRNVESAGATVLAAQESARDAQVSLVAEVALNYSQLRGAQQQIIIAQDNLKAQRHTADITRQRFTAGLVSGLDVANADGQVATTEAQIPELETMVRQSIYALSVLLARPPASLVAELSASEPVPVAPGEVPVGLPSDLLRRRPDIRAAEARLHAATAQIGVAVADLFPKFSLTGSLTYHNNLLRDWFADSNRAFSFGPTVTWPLFQGGSIVSNIRLQHALRDESYLTYQKTVLVALQDVENALIAFAKEQEHRESLSAAVTANKKAVDLSMQLYTQGQTDFLNVLNAQRSLYLAQDALVQSQRALATHLIALYKALGGGWQPEDRLASARPTGN